MQSVSSESEADEELIYSEDILSVAEYADDIYHHLRESEVCVCIIHQYI